MFYMSLDIGDYETIEYVHKHIFSQHEIVQLRSENYSNYISGAVLKGNDKNARLLINYGYKDIGNIIDIAIIEKDFETLKYLCEIGCEWTDLSFYYAIKGENLQIV